MWAIDCLVLAVMASSGVVRGAPGEAREPCEVRSPAPEAIPAPQSGDLQARRRAEEIWLAWSTAVEAHTAGHGDASVQLVARWSRPDLKVAFDRVQELLLPGSHDRPLGLRLVSRGVVLHTDAGAHLQGKGPAGPSSLLLVVDGRYEGTGRSLHLDFAADLLDLLPEPRHNKTVVLWYRAVSAYLLHNLRLGEAARHLARWRVMALGRDARPGAFPADEPFLFDYGCLHEALAAPFVRVSAGPGVLPEPKRQTPETWGSGMGEAAGGGRWEEMTATFQTDLQPFEVHLEQAYRAYRGVLETTRGHAEARVRLGRVEMLRGSVANAIKNLRAGSQAAGAEATVQYYGAMFLGQALEQRGQREEARREYERAASLFPRAQSPLLALSALAQRSGDRVAAERAAALLLSLPDSREQRYDPWWDYDGGRRDAESLFRELHARMREEKE